MRKYTMSLPFLRTSLLDHAVGVMEDKPLRLDLVVGDPFIACMEGIVIRIPFDGGDGELVCDLLVELLARWMIVVGEVVDAGQVVLEGIVDGGDYIFEVDHVGVVGAISR